jgi:hypothetical protein
MGAATMSMVWDCAQHRYDSPQSSRCGGRVMKNFTIKFVNKGSSVQFQWSSFS